MAHELTIRQSGMAEMAYVGPTPWHGLGQELQSGASIDEWCIAAGLDWDIKRAPVQFMNGQMHKWPSNEVLYRSDTNEPLSIVSDSYHIVQPRECLSFFSNLVEESGFEIETAGTHQGGRKVWALARTGFDAEVVENDPVRMYLLIVTSCDKGLSTKSYFTSVRAVCRNTLQLSLRDANSSNLVIVRHNTKFCADSVQANLGLNAGNVFDDFISKMRSHANASLTQHQAEEVVEAIFADRGIKGSIRQSRGFRTVMQLFNGVGKGSRLDGVAGTGWGVINAITEYTDFHARAANQDNRLASAWLGNGANLKEIALNILEEV
jgi:phage/plasmid-like protein (TIGR03299 family)